MSENVVYSEVVFVKKNKGDKDDRDECHLGNSSQAPQKTKHCCDSVRLVLMFFCIVLTGALIILTSQYVCTKNKLKDLQQLHSALKENLTVALQDMHRWAQNLSKALNESVCPKDWEYHAGKCYFFSTNKLSWADSRDACISDGSHLVIIKSRDEQEFLMGILGTKHNEFFWIGLTDEKEEGQWLWVDNTKLNEKIRYWNPNEPDDWKGYKGEYSSGEDCAHLFKNNMQDLNIWFDAVCKNTNRRICETRSSKDSGDVK
ncbi:immune-related, lectin-like receptor 4 [Labeo rohita]|uniref:immune-related, lectin-like receptor 4 n=1 Tax=Labeo rohita TaxID=84645 RepID=UPI0021E1DE33|nr:immune-related, lectin-like receptor 4 [Labeo rohita]